MSSEEFLANQLENLKYNVQQQIDDTINDINEFRAKTDLVKMETLTWVLEKIDQISFRYSRRLESD